MCALKGGRSVETTMGFSTLAGLPMGTRCGDLDPGIVLYLLAEKGMTVEQVQHLLYEESGLRGLSGASRNKTGRASCRGRVGQDGKNVGGGVTLKKKKNKK